MPGFPCSFHDGDDHKGPIQKLKINLLIRKHLQTWLNLKINLWILTEFYQLVNQVESDEDIDTQVNMNQKYSKVEI